MRTVLRSQFVAAVTGGVVVAGAFLAFGITGRGTTNTVIDQAPVNSEAASNGLTAHAIYVRDAPGVVFVRAQVVQQVPDPFELSGVAQQSSISTGSGFLIDSRGDILTNYHVIEGADRQSGVTVRFEDNVSRRAAVVGADPNNDIAVLHVNMGGVNVRPLVLGDSERVQVGDPTLAIGNPFGLDRTLTSGLVSALQRQISAPNGFSIENVIQTDAPINPGNSGGPLLDAAGHVIGINSQIETAANGGNGNVGIAFAVPIDTAKEFLPQLEHAAHVTVAYLGITARPSASASAGVVIESDDPGGPAATAGLRQGDAIQAVDGRRVATMDQVQQLVASSAPGAKMVLQVRRGHRKRTVAVRLGQRSEQEP
ncbi:MAG TPA: trypsin-like peptidase domain-containing protein [Solirubrobacteraceae bacterium]|jgi:S1-C subfamily serine protease|nr:trypsin-like peptidase domain-containing protein [Solirubrobacteraceae bacterium]